LARLEARGDLATLEVQGLLVIPAQAGVSTDEPLVTMDIRLLEAKASGFPPARE